MTESSNASADDSQGTPRRSFFFRFATLVVGAVVGLFPFVAGVGVLLDPLRRRKEESGDGKAPLLRIAPLEALPADGIPRPFVVRADRVDGWTKTPDEKIGVIYLTRTDTEGEPELAAFNSNCPHLGCRVEFNTQAAQFQCPCHVSGFSVGGDRLFGPSLRGLDSLQVELRETNGRQEIWVAFQQFRPAIAEKISS